MGELAIRDARVDDAVAVEAVHWASRSATYRHVAGWPPAVPDAAQRVELWRRWLMDPAITCLVSAVDGSINGICTLRPSTDQDADPAVVAEMPTLYVHPGAWHRGYGRALCAGAVRRASIRGFRSLTLWCMGMNVRAHEFFTAFGFTADGRMMAVDWPYDELVAYRYRIRLEGSRDGVS